MHRILIGLERFSLYCHGLIRVERASLPANQTIWRAGTPAPPEKKRHNTVKVALAFWLTLAIPARADEPKVVIAPVERANVGDIIIFDASASTGDVFEWIGDEGPTFRPIPAGDSTKYLAAMFASPGKQTIKFVAIGVVDGKAKKATGTATVEIIERPAPVPPPAPPDPPPGPKPDPAPITGKLYVSLIVDTNAMTIGLAKIRKGNEIRAQRQSLDFEYITHATTDKDIAAYNLQPAIDKAGGAPCLIIQGPVNPATGKADVLLKEKAPIDEAGVLERIKFVRAGGRTP